MPSLPSPEPTVSCFDDLDFFKDFVNEFPTIFYNDAQMSKSDLLTEPILSPQHIDGFDLNDEASVSEYDEEEQNRHQCLRYEGLHHTNDDIMDFEARLTRIYKREVHRVHVFDFGGLPNLMAEGLSARMLMEHRDAQGQSVFTSRA
ncbi:TraB domain-containing protein [Tanacetum coccineum]